MTRDIRTRAEVHAAHCHRPATTWPDRSAGVGTVRRCPHGIIQEAVSVPGWGSCGWRDLSPLFTPLRYRRARRALHHHCGDPTCADCHQDTPPPRPAPTPPTRRTR